MSPPAADPLLEVRDLSVEFQTRKGVARVLERDGSGAVGGRLGFRDSDKQGIAPWGLLEG